jgi:hypothetical protein
MDGPVFLLGWNIYEVPVAQPGTRLPTHSRVKRTKRQVTTGLSRKTAPLCPLERERNVREDVNVGGGAVSVFSFFFFFFFLDGWSVRTTTPIKANKITHTMTDNDTMRVWRYKTPEAIHDPTTAATTLLGIFTHDK